MTETSTGHTGRTARRVPSEELDEIPMDDYSTRIQNSRPTGEYQRRLAAENCWSSMIRNRLIVVLSVLLTAIVIALIAIGTYLVIAPDVQYTEVINKVTEVKYPPTEEATADELESEIGARIPIFSIQDEPFEENMLDNLIKDTYKVLPVAAYQAGRMKRMKRNVEEETSIETCKKRHDNCKALLNKVKKMTRNVSQQVHQLQRMINRLGIVNEELPSLQNVTALDFATCLRCERLENQTANINVNETAQILNSETTNNTSQSQIYGDSNINDTVPSIYEESLIKNTSSVLLPEIGNESTETATLLPNVTYSEQIVNVTEKNASVIEDPENSYKKTLSSLVNESTVIWNSSSDSKVNPDNEMNDLSEKAGASVTDSHANDGPDDFYFHHSLTNRNSASKFGQVEPIDEPEVFQSGASTVNVTEVVLTTTEDNLAAVSSTLNPEKDDRYSVLTSSSIDQTYSPQAKANGELNRFIIPTAETTKGSLQVTYTPNVNWMPYPLCVYGPPNPPPQSVRLKSSESITFPDSTPSYSSQNINHIQHGQSSSSSTSNERTLSYNLNFVQPIMQPPQQGIQFLPTQFQPPSGPVLPQRYGPTGPGTQYFPVNQAYHQPTATGQSRPLYCAYLPTPTFQFPVVPGVSEFQRAVPDSGSNPSSVNIDSNDLDELYQQKLKSRDYTAGCPRNSRACSDHRQCIPKSRWCDGEVDCRDASDETQCSCRDRVDRERLCDGYFDCPLGEDELGCFGCDKRSFSCDNSENRKRWGNCVSLLQRCDGFADCKNGKDEMDCNIITHSVEEREMFTVGYTSGYLHRNLRGKWYPACTATKTWANDACRAEIGDENYRDFPLVETVSLQQNYNGPYVSQTSLKKIQIVEACSGKAVYVNCPKMPCGTRVSSHDDTSLFEVPYSERFRSREMQDVISEVSDNYSTEEVKSTKETDGKTNTHEDPPTSGNDKTLNAQNATDNNDAILGESRVVGGRPSQPKAWPSLVAINRDGNFHCGGVILDEIWVLTAAHCIDGHHKHYYDIQSGILRRFSYSPMEQSRKVSHIVMYPSYDRAVMKNDLALLRLETPLNFNRWVRPACLPEVTTAGPYWRMGPAPKTTCISAGWGSTVEHGPDPDHLREVDLPILPNCKYLVDQNEAEICAGRPQGGRDTCQGDSGGPLMCRNPNSLSQWYVAGIVSHGEGCARPNEPGAYTKVSRFVEWINDIRSRHELPKHRPLQRCPGYYCHSGSGRCYSSKRRCDKSVDCMDAEDELNCHKFTDFSIFKSANSEDRDSLARKVADDSSSIKNETDGPESTTIAPSTTPSSTVESSTTSTEVTIVQSTMTQTTENNEQYSTTIKPIQISTTVTMSTTSQTTEETNQEITTIKPDENLMNVTTEIKTGTTPSVPLQHFSCRILLQTIALSKRCDKIVDCEDGTDEENCTCKDYLAKISPASICDGHIDCHDVTDEENCEICSPEEFQCKRSRECVPLAKRCNIKGDCEFNEDELGCMALTNGKYVITDIDGMPHHNMEGILTSYENGKWVPFCIDRKANRAATLGKQMCSYFGFVGCESFNETRIETTPFEVRTSSASNLIPYEYSTIISLATEEEPRCTALYLRCLPTIHTVPMAYQVKGIAGQDDTFLWPWHAAVFVDGQYRCSAVLLEPSWLLTSIYCTDNVDLNQNYTTALLGVSRSYLQVDGPHQQMSKVDGIKTVKNSDAVLLHLKYPANMTRHVQPMYLQKRTHAPAESDTCATVGVDEEQRTRTVFLKAVIHNCPDNHRCYKNVKTEKCQNATMSPWSGTVVCFGCSGWYPAAVYHADAGLCSFSEKQSFSSIDYINTNLITGMQELVKPALQEPICEGFRCPLGKCIEFKKVCDGVPHCRDGSDEDADYCLRIKDNCANGVHDTIGCHCAQSELRCANGQCVPKSSFCDGQIDCVDGTDEPLNCTCAAYLKLTAPDRICDGRRHCFDKSDESPDLCYCKDASFKCDKNEDQCVSQDFVCDGEPDCSSGEDEKHCQSLTSLLSHPPGYGEVIQRTCGVWHSRCFPAGDLTDDKLLTDDICQEMGYSYANNLTESDNNGIRNSPMVPKLDKFHMVRLNPNTWIIMRDDKAFVNLHPPLETCYRHYVTCVL